MIIETLMAASFTLKPVFPPETSMAKRVDILRHFFEPAPFEVVKAERIELIKKKDNPSTIKGYIKVTPPKGSCFIVRTNVDRKDRNVCKTEFLSFTVSDIDRAGNINWLVIQGPNDTGTKLSWQTPYRKASIIKLGEFKQGLEYNHYIKSCKAIVTPFQKKINLELMDGKKWTILLPDKDIEIKRPEHVPNLFVRILTNRGDGKVLTNEYKMWGQEDGKQKEAPDSEQPPKVSRLAQKLSGQYKKKKITPFKFSLRKPSTYEMESSQLLENNTPKGILGKCRYRYAGAPGDIESGVIECFNTEAYDALYAHLTCSLDLLR
jgi:hypothetical protein